MDYISTRGEAVASGFNEVLLAGLATDGGLYVPKVWPKLDSHLIERFAGKTFAEVAFHVLEPFVDGDIATDDLKAIIEESYGTFAHKAVAPLVQVGDRDFILELFHGPTLAFKDVAMQLLARLMDHVLQAKGQRATIVGATSGDTGAAAVQAFAGKSNVDVFILHPHGRVSEVQRRQMTTVNAKNIHNIALDGTFDDCQAIVKGMFGDAAFRDKVSLSGVNSINWARIAAQVTYYFTSAVALGAPHRKIAFSVPTGNFGDILAGYVAKRMGLPMEKLLVATNANDILDRVLKTGEYKVDQVVPSTSPSMDIQVSSNFERLIFEAAGRDADLVRALMASLKQSGSFTLPPAVLGEIRKDFASNRADNDTVAATIKTLKEETGYIADPHTACGFHAALEADLPSITPRVTLATAHPAKFPDAVKAACGQWPDLPPHMSDLYERKERFDQIGNDEKAVKTFMLAKLGMATA